MAHIHFTGALVARAEEDAFTRGKSFYVKVTDAQETRAYLPARDSAHAQSIAAAINGETRKSGETAAPASRSEGE
jgi:hypothetical protein